METVASLSMTGQTTRVAINKTWSLSKLRKRGEGTLNMVKGQQMSHKLNKIKVLILMDSRFYATFVAVSLLTRLSLNANIFFVKIAL
jgi:hypothetical protein